MAAANSTSNAAQGGDDGTVTRDTLVVAILVVGAVVIVVSIVVGHHDRRVDRRRLPEVAADLGLDPRPDGVLQPPGELTLFAGRRGSRTSWVLVAAGGQEAIFRYTYREDQWTGDPEDSGTTRRSITCVVLELPFWAPPLMLVPGRVPFRPQDDFAEAGSPEFRSRWSTLTDDTTFAHRLVSPEVEAALAAILDPEEQRGRHGDVVVEFARRRLLVASCQVRVAEYPERLELARGLRDALPVSLEIFYPANRSQ